MRGRKPSAIRPFVSDSNENRKWNPESGREETTNKRMQDKKKLVRTDAKSFVMDSKDYFYSAVKERTEIRGFKQDRKILQNRPKDFMEI